MTGHPDIAAARMHGLALWSPIAGGPRDVVRRLVAVQAQEHPYARWSIAQRMATTTTSADLDRAFDDGEMLRTHVLRPTWHYVAPDDLRWLLELSGPRVHAWNARRYGELLLDPPTLERTLTAIHDALADGPLTRREIGERLGLEHQQLAYALMHAELHLCVCSGPMKGKQHTYGRFDDRVPPSDRLDEDEALARLASRYLGTRGPATAKDFAWWAGLKMGDARRALALTDAETTNVDGRTYFTTDSGTTRTASRQPDGPVVDLVQCYDEVIISYTESRDALRAEQATFPVPGRPDGGFMHVVLLDGHLLGHWRFGKSGIDVRLAHEVDAASHHALDAAVARLEGWW